jgi:hypothetical protein
MRYGEVWEAPCSHVERRTGMITGRPSLGSFSSISTTQRISKGSQSRYVASGGSMSWPV